MARTILEQYIEQVIMEAVRNSIEIMPRQGGVQLKKRGYTVHDKAEWDFITQELGDDVEITQPWNGEFNTGMFTTTMPDWKLQGMLVRNQSASRDRPVVPRARPPLLSTTSTRKDPCPPCPPCPETPRKPSKRRK